jgi:hypothetical protein
MFFSSCFYQLFRELFKCFCVECIYSIHLFRRGRKITEFSLLRQVILLQMAQTAKKRYQICTLIRIPFQRRRICLDILRLSFPIYLKIDTLGVHVSAQRNYMFAIKKCHSQSLSKHSYFKVTIQPAAGYLVNYWLYGDFSWIFIR